jgi:endonuclease/exonuclease/phosphatase family metal-dependent hydrolase
MAAGTHVRWSSAACALVVLLGGFVLTEPVAAADEFTVKTGTFNVRSVRHDLHKERNEEPWRVRREFVVRDILAEDLDVVGIQEASQNPKYGARMADGPTQYQDLVAGLNQAGGSYAVTNEDIRASRDTRIVYNTETLDVVRQGAYQYRTQSGGANDQRFLVWAVFRIRATGAEFFFATTHLVNKVADLQTRQWTELIAKVQRLHDGLPVVVGGDFQSSKKLGTVASRMMTKMRRAGFNDVLNQRPGQPWLSDRRARVMRQRWVNSANHFDRDLRRYSYENHRRYIGNSIDWVFASNALRVERYRVVVRFDRETLRLRGVIPSDHFLVTARVVIPG